MASHGADDPYHRVDAVKAGMTGAMITGAAGLFAASIKNAMRVENVGSLGVFTMSGGIITTFGMASQLCFYLPKRLCTIADLY